MAMAYKSPESSANDQVVVDANYLIFVLGIIVLTLVNSVLWLLLRDQDQSDALIVINVGLSVFLLGDAFYRSWRRSNRLYDFTREYGWLMVVGSMPLPFFGIARLIHFRLVVGKLRQAEFRAARNMIVTQRAQSTLLLVVLVAVTVYELAVLWILGVESHDPAANIVSANDALWWGFVTVSTVGYGDRCPVTTGGRIVGIALIAVAVGLFTGITSLQLP